MADPFFEIEVNLPNRGVCSVQFTVQPADPTVGIMADGPDELSVVNSDGVDITDNLTEAEDDIITERCCNYLADRSWDE